jgi:hypothetical protein
MSNSRHHDQHFAAIDRYLRDSLGCRHTLIEPGRPRLYQAAVWPAPDVVGLCANPMHMIAVDVKVSRSDSQQHLNKPHVQSPTLGVGSHRYIAAPLGVLVDVPDDWGLLVIDGEDIREASEPRPYLTSARNLLAENWLYALVLNAIQFGEEHGGKSRPNRRAEKIIDAINGKGRMGVSGLIRRAKCSEKEVLAAVEREPRLRLVQDGGGRFVELND